MLIAMALLAVARVAAAQGCPPGDLARGMTVSAVAAHSDPSRITSARRLADGTAWNAPDAVVLESSAAELAVDLAQESRLRALELQADNNDEYVVDASLDGRRWQPLAIVPKLGGSGLRTRTLALRNAVAARYVRVRPLDGDGRYSVARLSAYCQPPRSVTTAPIHAAYRWWRWRSLTDGDLVLVKGLVAFAAFVILAWGWHVRRVAAEPRGHRQTRDAALVVLAALSFGCWWNLGRFHYDSFVHTHEFFHYYLGTKYAPELGYTLLYECTVVAEADQSPAAALEHRRVRNLSSRELQDVAPIVAHPEACKSHFSAQRWDDFTRDVLFFRSQTSHAHWVDSMLTDYGFNGTPAWSLLARPLASLSDASTRQIRALAAIDPLLLVAMWLIVWWAFGWRAMCVAVIFWGTNYPARYWWNGGAFLRMDWLLCSVAGVCLLRKERLFAAGALLCYAALLRVFPGAMIAAVALGIAIAAVRERSLAPLRSQRRFIVGVVVTAALLVPLSLWPAGRGAWGAFVRNGERHHASVMTNHLGMRTLLSFSAEGRAMSTRDRSLVDPWRNFRDTHQRMFERRRALFVLANLALLILLARASTRRPAWQMAILGIGLVPFATYLACYYYSFLLMYAFLFVEEEGFAPALAALSALSCLAAACWREHDDQFVFISAIVLLFTGITGAWGALRRAEITAQTVQTPCRSKRRRDCESACTPPGTKVGGVEGL